MAKTADLKLRFLSDTSQATAGLDSVGKKTGKFAAGLKIAGGTALVAGAAVKVGYDKMIKPAGELEQSVGAIDSVFKGNSKQMHTWAKGAATDVGLTKNEYNELGVLIGSQLKNGGTAMDKLAPKTNGLIKQGADLSAMFGGTTADAVSALSSALKGERDPIEKYGVSLKQSSIDAEAARLGYKKVGGALSDQANQAATLSLITKQTKDAQGTFAKESETLAGKQQRLTAQYENAKATIGTALLPIATKFFGFLADKALPAITKLIDGFSGAGDMGDFGAKLGLDKVGPIFTEITGGIRAFAAAWKFNDGEVTSSGFAGYMEQLGFAARQVFGFLKTAGAVVLPILVKAFKTVGPVLLDVGKSIIGLVTAVAQRLVPVLKFLAPIITQVFTNIINILKPALQFIGALIRTVTSVIKGDWSGAWNGIKDMFRAVWSLLKAIVTNALSTIKLALSLAWTAIKAVAVGAWNGIKALIGLAWDGIKALVMNRVNLVKAGLSAAWTFIKDKASAAWTWVKDKVVGLVTGLQTTVQNRVDQLRAAIQQKWDQIKNNALTAWNSVKSTITGAVDKLKAEVATRVENVKRNFTELPGKIKAALSGAGTMLLNAGRDIVGGLLKGITEKIGAVKTKFTDLTKDIPNWKGPHSVDKRLLEPAGAAIMGGLIRSIDKQRGHLRATLKDVTRDVTGTRITAPELLNARAPMFSPRANARRAAAGGTVINITVNGAVDRMGTARDIRRLLNDYDVVVNGGVA